MKLAKSNASDEEIIAAAKKAGCHEWITSLENGYDTVIGESGSSVSGGERQRIAVARAILKDAPIILLDEATASLDIENESLVQQSINELVKGKTIIIVAHHLNTIKNADKIVVIDDKKVVEEGTHTHILQNIVLTIIGKSNIFNSTSYFFTGSVLLPSESFSERLRSYR